MYQHGSSTLEAPCMNPGSDSSKHKLTYPILTLTTSVLVIAGPKVGRSASRSDRCWRKPTGDSVGRHTQDFSRCDRDIEEIKLSLPVDRQHLHRPRRRRRLDPGGRGHVQRVLTSVAGPSRDELAGLAPRAVLYPFHRVSITRVLHAPEQWNQDPSLRSTTDPPSCRQRDA
jgi:hypothetical protein